MSLTVNGTAMISIINIAADYQATTNNQKKILINKMKSQTDSVILMVIMLNGETTCKNPG
jgi:hypothetical protein